MRRFNILGLGAVVLAASACGLPQDPGGQPDTQNPECQIKATTEKGPGFPYDLQQYETQVAPLLVANCSAAGCHGAPKGNSNFTVWADTAKGKCSFAQTFNSLSASIDLNNPSQSAVIIAVNGTDSIHPVKSDTAAALLLDYSTRAQAAQGGGGPNNNPNIPAIPFSFDVFQSQIQPILEHTGGLDGCAAGSCHGSNLGAAGLKITKGAAPGSQQMIDNFVSVTNKASLAGEANGTTLYLRATTKHGGGASTVVSSQEAQTILAWIIAAKANTGGGVGNCVPVSNFNVDVFRDDIQPVLFGQLGNAAGCSLGACHGLDRQGGALVIKETNTAEQNLAAFACFVDLTNPVASAILACPSKDYAHCPQVADHPGQDVFQGATDPNYQRVLSYLYATKTTVAPLDFAFFVRQINPIFNDVAAVQGGAQNRTCADTFACHGVVGAGSPAPNGSNFPIISNSSDKQSLQFNFSSAVNFTNFITPEGSSLFLYPTNEIANLDNPFATGLPHPGGLDFDVNSQQALAILKWAKGLRPDNQGFMLDWLVAGDYGAADINGNTFINESTIAPNIFDPDGAAQFNQGQWEGFFSPSQNVDLNAQFNRAQTAGRIAYAVAYVINTTSIDIDAQMTITSNNAIKVYVDGAPVLQANNAQAGTTALARFKSFSGSKKSTRLLIKVFQSANVNDFKFSVQLSDQFGNALTDKTGELVIKLSPDGGI